MTFRAIRFQTQLLACQFAFLAFVAIVALADFFMPGTIRRRSHRAHQGIALHLADNHRPFGRVEYIARRRLALSRRRHRPWRGRRPRRSVLADSPRQGNATKDAVWFRREIEVPKTLNGYDLTGTRIWFQFHANANGPMPEIIYFNGRRVAMGDDLEPIVLFDNAQPGDKILVAVKILQTVDDKRFNGVTPRSSSAANRPSPDDLRMEFLAAAVLMPSLAPGRPPTSMPYAQRRSLPSISRRSPPATRPQFDASLKAAQSQLEALKPLLKQATFHLTGNSHIDAAWLWPWTETVDVVQAHLRHRAAADVRVPGLHLHPVRRRLQRVDGREISRHERRDQASASRKAAGRSSAACGSSPTSTCPTANRSSVSCWSASAGSRTQYGVDVRIGWNPDSFGYTWQLPQIYKKSGVDYFVTQKMTWNDTNQLPFKLFWWESPDGVKVLTYFPHDYVNTTSIRSGSPTIS